MVDTSRKIKILDKTFRLSIPESKLKESIKQVAFQINASLLPGECPVFIGILNGSFMFLADLMKYFNRPCEVTFIKVASYQGTQTSGKVRNILGVDKDLTNRKVILVEDIVDTGTTLDFLIKAMEAYEPASVEIATLLFKPDAYKGKHPINYLGLKIPNNFIVGYGLDYNGFGRNYPDIYELDNTETL